MNREKAEAVVDAIIDAVVRRVNADIIVATLPMFHHKHARQGAEDARQRAIDALCPKPKEDNETC